MTAAELVARLTGLVKEQADIIQAQADALAQLGAVADIEKKMEEAAAEREKLIGEGRNGGAGAPPFHFLKGGNLRRSIEWQMKSAF